MGTGNLIFRVALLAASVVGLPAAAPLPAGAEGLRSLKAALTLHKGAYLSGEEIVVRIALTNTSPGGSGNANTLFLPPTARSASFELFSVLGGRPIRPRRGGASDGLRLTFPGHPPLPPLLTGPGVGAPLVSPSGPLLAPNARAFTGALRPGETARTDYELLGEYGVLPAGGYRLRFTYVGETGVVMTGWAPFSVFEAGPVVDAQGRAYEELAAEADPETVLREGRAFLFHASSSIYASRVRREMLDAAVTLRQWRLAVELGRTLLTSQAAPLWHQPREAVGVSVATALWNLGRAEEAQAVLLAVNPAEYGVLLQRIRGGR